MPIARKKRKTRSDTGTNRASASEPATQETVLNGLVRQSELPAMVGEGVEKPHHPDIDAAAESFSDLHQRRKDLKAGEDEAKEKLAAAMLLHSLAFYEYENTKHVAKIVTARASKVKVVVKELGIAEHE